MNHCSNLKYKRKLPRMDPGGASMLTFNRVVMYTNNFSDFVGTFQFGKIYRAKYETSGNQYTSAMVKIWDVSGISNQAANLIRAMNEVILFQHEKMIQHPGMIEFLEFCWDGQHLGVLYNFGPLDSVHNLVPKDTFTWLQRIKVALGFAYLLRFLQTSKFLVRNITAAHILVDEEYNPKLCDIGMIVGGIFPNETMYTCKGCYGYVDPHVGCSGEWSEKTDVFAFGVLLLNLITKRVDIEHEKLSDAPLLYVWALDQFECFKSENHCTNPTLSLVDQSLTTKSGFSLDDGCEITNLALKCVNQVANERPTMKQVVKCLRKLEVVMANSEFMKLEP